VTQLFSGVYPVIQTPFDPQGAVDPAQLQDELSWIFGHGAAGAVVGMVSEIAKLSDRERESLNEMVCDAAHTAGRQAIVSVGAESTRHALERCAHAERVGADALMATPPLLNPIDSAGLIGYFGLLFEATRAPVIVQDASGYVGQEIPIDVLVELQDRYGERIYFKPEAPPIGARLSQLRDRTHGRARIFEGSGGIALVDSHRRGIVGTMPAADLCWALVALWNALEAGETVVADAIAGPLAAILTLQTTLDSYVCVEKYLLHRQGVLSSAALRGPVGFGLDPETIGEIDRQVAVLAAAVNGGFPVPGLRQSADLARTQA